LPAKKTIQTIFPLKGSIQKYLIVLHKIYGMLGRTKKGYILFYFIIFDLLLQMLLIMLCNLNEIEWEKLSLHTNSLIKSILMGYYVYFSVSRIVGNISNLMVEFKVMEQEFLTNFDFCHIGSSKFPKISQHSPKFLKTPSKFFYENQFEFF
jgi:hypothetical protein